MQQGAAAAIPLGLLSFQRTLELEADRLAIGMMAGAGCDPDALVRYIGRVQPQPDGTTPKVYSPLPERDQRLTAMEQAIQGLPARAYSSGEEFPPIQDEVRRLAPRAPSLVRPQ
jgi:predicted Zn-dependent protease